MSVFSCDVDDSDAPVCAGDEELSLLLQSEESIFRSVSTGFCFATLCFPTAAAGFVAVVVVPVFILLFALVCRNRVCCTGALEVMGTRLLPEYVGSACTFVIFDIYFDLFAGSFLLTFVLFECDIAMRIVDQVLLHIIKTIITRRMLSACNTF